MRTKSTTPTFRVRCLCALGSVALVTAASIATAAPPTKEECVETFSRAQDYREKGKVSDAKRLFFLCAQQSCPALIQSDCAKFGDELDRSVPSLSFSVRDGKGADLPDAQVFIDGMLIASRTDDGKAHDIDPGKHTIRFAREGRETILNIVVAVGEKNRNVSAVIGGEVNNGGTNPTTNPNHRIDESSTTSSRPIFPLVVAGIGGAGLITGAILTIVGLNKVPSQCTTSPRECAASPDDPVFGDAKSAIHLANTGVAVGIAGTAVAVLGLVWYFSSSPKESNTPASAAIVPFTDGHESGAAVHLTF
jgi:hypothetical protein